jgi:hypothetical protein
MPAMLILAVAVMGLVLVVLAVVVAGIRQEPSTQELTRQAPRLIATLARRLLGVYVRRPDPSVSLISGAGDEPHSTRSRSPAG